MKKIIVLLIVFNVMPLAVCAVNGAGIELNLSSAKELNGIAGDFVTVNGEIRNNTAKPVNNITTYISLVNLDTKMPVDLEDWSAEKGLFIGTIGAKQALPLAWKIHFVQAGNYALAVVANIKNVDRPVVSSLTYFKVAPKKNLNPGNVLPVALGEPILILFVFFGLAYFRNSKNKIR